MNPYQIHETDLIEGCITEMGDDCPTMTWNGSTWNILPGSAMFNRPLREGGFSQMFDLSLTVGITQFLSQSFPDANTLEAAMLNTQLTYLNVSYKIANIHIAPGAVQMDIHANSLNQKA